uniref:Biogenic amine-like GPCR n=1 Tax=Tripedalia cystophora TaxID=6141 RepID=A0A481ZQF3_TRICY|nr:biogenic amine-like GPCR [Tripedalia cystophora]
MAFGTLNTSYTQEEPVFELKETFFASFFVSGLMVASWILNGLIAFLFFRKGELRQTPSNKLVLNLVATNCICGLFVLPALLLSTITQKWILGEVGCQMFGIISTASFAAWPLTLASLSIDRFHFIVNPLSYPVNMTLFKTNVMLCLVWIYCVITSIMPLFVEPSFQYSAQEHICAPDWGRTAWFAIYNLIMSYIIPLLVQCWCYTHIVLAARRQAKFGRRLSRVSDVPLERARIIRETSASKAVKKTIYVLGSYVLIYTPYSVYLLLRLNGLIPSFIGFWLYLCVITTTIVYPVLFVLRAKGLKREVRELVHGCRLSKNRVNDINNAKSSDVRLLHRFSGDTRLSLLGREVDGYDSETSLAQPFPRRRSVTSERRVSWNLQPTYFDTFTTRVGGGSERSDGDVGGNQTDHTTLMPNPTLPGQIPA